MESKLVGQNLMGSHTAPRKIVSCADLRPAERVFLVHLDHMPTLDPEPIGSKYLGAKGIVAPILATDEPAIVVLEYFRTADELNAIGVMYTPRIFFF